MEATPDFKKSQAPEMTVGEWWRRWLPAVDLAPSTLEAYAQQYRRHVGPRFSRVRLDEVSALDLSQFSRGLREQGLAPSSVAVAMSVIRDLLQDAAAEGLIPAAPAPRVRQRRAGQGQPARVGVAVDLGTVLAVGERLPAQEALMVIVAAFTEMRWGEVCGMRTSSLHLQPARLGTADRHGTRETGASASRPGNPSTAGCASTTCATRTRPC
jgi:integrase